MYNFEDCIHYLHNISHRLFNALKLDQSDSSLLFFDNVSQYTKNSIFEDFHALPSRPCDKRWRWVRIVGEMILTGEKPKCSENNLFQCYFVHHKSHMHWPWIESRQDFNVRGRRLTAAWCKHLVYIIQRMLIPTLWETIAGGFIRAQVSVISILDL